MIFGRKKEREEVPKEPTPKKEKEPKKEWDGQGTGTWAAIRRWYYTRFKGYVILREFNVNWDLATPKDENEAFDCTLTHRMIKKKDLPDRAVHCTGEPHVYSLDHAEIRYGEHDEGFKATDAWLFLEFGGFDDCLSKKWTEFDHVDIKKVLIIIGIVLAVAIGLFMFRGH